MSPVQTTYGDRMAKGVPGLPQGTDWDADTGIIETEDGIGFGLPVSQGAGDIGVVLGGALTGFRGVTQRDVSLGVRAGVDADVYPQYANAGIFKRGKIWVTSGADGIVAGDPVHYNSSTGAWLKTGGVGPIAHARYASAGDSGDLVLLELFGSNQKGT